MTFSVPCSERTKSHHSIATFDPYAMLHRFTLPTADPLVESSKQCITYIACGITLIIRTARIIIVPKLYCLSIANQAAPTS